MSKTRVKHARHAGRSQWDDLFTPWRKVLHHRAGLVKWYKRADAKIQRRKAKQEIRRDLSD